MRLVNGMIIWRKHFIGLEPFSPANVVSMLKVFDPAWATFKFVRRYMERFSYAESALTDKLVRNADAIV